MRIQQYFRKLKKLIDSYSIVTSWTITEDARTNFEGFTKGKIHFNNNSVLNFREYVNTSGSSIKKYAYSYHYQISTNLIFRYDNTPHHPSIPSFPHHKHLASGKVVVSPAADLKLVLEEITKIIK